MYFQCFYCFISTKIYRHNPHIHTLFPPKYFCMRTLFSCPIPSVKAVISFRSILSQKLPLCYKTSPSQQFIPLISFRCQKLPPGLPLLHILSLSIQTSGKSPVPRTLAARVITLYSFLSSVPSSNHLTALLRLITIPAIPAAVKISAP